MTCIEELHQQLGGVVVAKLEALSVKPAQLKQLQARFQQLAISGETVQDFPLFQAVTAEPSGRRAGSATSRSDSSTQVRLCLPAMASLKTSFWNALLTKCPLLPSTLPVLPKPDVGRVTCSSPPQTVGYIHSFTTRLRTQ